MGNCIWRSISTGAMGEYFLYCFWNVEISPRIGEKKKERMDLFCPWFLWFFSHLWKIITAGMTPLWHKTKTSHNERSSSIEMTFPFFSLTNEGFFKCRILKCPVSFQCSYLLLPLLLFWCKCVAFFSCKANSFFLLGNLPWVWERAPFKKASFSE